MVIKRIEIPKECAKTSEFTLHQFQYENFNPIQTAFLYCKEKANVIVTAPTSTGKTTVAEIEIFNTIHNGGTVVYIVPLRALAYEKKIKWGQLKELQIIALTGDSQKSTKKRLQTGELKRRLIIITSEMFDSILKKRNKYTRFLNSISSVIVDEAHLISYPLRGPALEYVISKTAILPQSPKFILLTATMSNSEDIAEWVDGISPNHTYIIETGWSPCEIKTHYIPYSYYRYKVLQVDEILSKIESIVSETLYSEDKSKKTLIFTHSVDLSQLIARKLQQKFMIGSNIIAHYNADLQKEKREKILDSFNQREAGIMVLVSTSGLAWGVNTPAANVVVVGVKRNTEIVNTMDLRQMAGRAGRVGIHDRGDVYILINSMKYQGILDDEMIVTSQMDNIESLSFHILSEINNGYNTREKISEFIKTTLGYKQGLITEELVDEAIEKLQGWQCITIDDNDDINITYLGRLCCVFYYLPEQVYMLNNGFSYLYESIDDREISWAIGNAMKSAYSPQELSTGIAEYQVSLMGKHLRFRKGREPWGYVYSLLLRGEQRVKSKLYYQAEADRGRLSSLLGLLYAINRYPPLLYASLLLEYGKKIDKKLAHLLAVERQPYKKCISILNNNIHTKERYLSSVLNKEKNSIKSEEVGLG